MIPLIFSTLLLAIVHNLGLEFVKQKGFTIEISKFQFLGLVKSKFKAWLLLLCLQHSYCILA